MPFGLSKDFFIFKYRRDAKEMAENLAMELLTHHLANSSWDLFESHGHLKVRRKFGMYIGSLWSNKLAFICSCKSFRDLTSIFATLSQESEDLFFSLSVG